ncbi:MAG: PEP-CTERM sorting domain-containing protein [Phycisphaerae bacterium]|nr:PEP-CTERM sorting domain-containing protein [Phycisphaerae bacterium]
MTKRLLVFLAVAFIITAVPAFATTISYNTSTPVPLTRTNWSNTLAFQKFDSSLGILNSVRLDVNGVMSTVITVDSNSYATGDVKTEVVTTVQNSSGLDLMSPLFTFTDLYGSVTSGTLTKSGSSYDIYTTPAILSAFSGTGNILLNASTFTSTWLHFTSGNATASQVTDASLNGTVTYDYTIPEPATITLLCAGAFALLRRKK